jgi:phasin family protein
LVGEVLPPDVRSIGAMAPANNFPVSIQAIANAYGDYSRKSFEESLSFVEKLMGVRSLDKAIELQTEFAKQAYANLVAESQKICELYGELAKQVFRPWAAVLTQSGRRP